MPPSSSEVNRQGFRGTHRGNLPAGNFSAEHSGLIVAVFVGMIIELAEATAFSGWASAAQELFSSST